VILLPVAVIVINIFLKPANSLPFIFDIALFGALVILIAIKIKEAARRAFFLICAAALFAGFYIVTVFSREIVAYKGQIAAAEYVNQKPFDKFHLYVLNAENNLFQFYCKRPVDLIPIEQFDNFKPEGVPVFYVNQQSMDQLTQNHAHFRVIRSFINYPKENILPAFINRTTRYKTLDHVYLVTK